MTLTLHLQFLSWQFALIVTLIGIVVTLFVGHNESKHSGDFSLPLMTFAVFLVCATASICCWAFVIAHHFWP